MPKIFTLLLFVAMGFAHADECERLLTVPTLTAPFRFAEKVDVVNLRKETTGFSVLKNREELQKAFLTIRDAQIVKIESLHIKRRLPWPKFQATDAGYVRIPWKLNEEHCYIRAEMAAAILVDGGFPLPAAVSVVSDQNRLDRSCDDGEEPVHSLFPSLNPQAVLAVGEGNLNIDGPVQSHWSWHVAVSYVVGGDLWILDPALNFDGPLLFEDWYRRLADGVPQIQVEVGWPFGLANRYKRGRTLSLPQCVSGSEAEKVLLAPEEAVTPLTKVYKNFQEQVLSAYCHHDIDPERFAELTHLLWDVAGPLGKKSDLNHN